MNTMNKIYVDICVIGAGSGGLSVAAGAVQMGASVALVESAKMGGDCLNYGCVPSKALLAAAKRAEALRTSDKFGIASVKPKVDFKAVMKHVQEAIKTIEPNDSVERFTNLGVQVFKEEAHFINPKTLRVGDTRISAKRFVIATGSSPAIPPIPGLMEVKYLTNESVFKLKELPKRLIIIGGGPIGCEMAQAFSRLGSKVTVLEMRNILPKDDPECVDVVRKRLINEEIEIREGAQIMKVGKSKTGVTVTLEVEGKREQLSGSHILVAAGRKPNLNGLKLDKAEVAYVPQGIKVDERLRTTNKRTFAIGDVVGGYQFTHMANYQAGIVIRNALFRLPSKAKPKAVPWVSYTDPELAHAGLLHEEAHGKHSNAKTWKFKFDEIDRAITDRETDGFIKVTTTKKGKILGVSIVGAHAGELILPWVIAIEKGQEMGLFTSAIVPYPTLSEISKRVAGSFFTPMLFSGRTKRIVKFLLSWG